MTGKLVELDSYRTPPDSESEVLISTGDGRWVELEVIQKDGSSAKVSLDENRRLMMVASLTGICARWKFNNEGP